MTGQPSAKPPLLEQVRPYLRLKHYNIRTEETKAGISSLAFNSGKPRLKDLYL
jgi:hypothetical protein